MFVEFSKKTCHFKLSTSLTITFMPPQSVTTFFLARPWLANFHFYPQMKFYPRNLGSQKFDASQRAKKTLCYTFVGTFEWNHQGNFCEIVKLITFINFVFSFCSVNPCPARNSYALIVKMKFDKIHNQKITIQTIYMKYRHQYFLQASSSEVKTLLAVLSKKVKKEELQHCKRIESYQQILFEKLNLDLTNFTKMVTF